MAEAEAAEQPYEHYETIAQQHEAARLGMWLFLATETLLFGGIFTSYAVYHSLYPEAFGAAARHLAWILEAANTVVLISSGFTMAVVDHYAAHLDRQRMMRFLALTIFLGLMFLSLKGLEYHGDFHDGIVPFLPHGWHYDGPDPQRAKLFFNFYFLLTALHATHMVVAVSLLSILLVRIYRWRKPYNIRRMVWGVGLFWAFIDVAWLFIYSSLYLIDRGAG